MYNELLRIKWLSKFIFVVHQLNSQTRPRIRIIATGGSIAGISQSNIDTRYEAARIDVDQLIQAVPEIHDLAEISAEQLVKIASQDMNDQVWLQLAHRIEELLEDDRYDGIVITHGTDTMEETAYFLNLTIHTRKPIVLVGAMRPSNALSADGPKNIYNAVLTAIAFESKGKGVLVVMNNMVFGARDLMKFHTTCIESFKSVNSGPLGYIYNGKVFYSRMPLGIHTYRSEFDVFGLKSLPKVGIVYGYANASAAPVKALISEGFEGIVHAGVGNGNIYKEVFEHLIKAQKEGVQVVRSSRVLNGSITLDAEIDDAKYHFVASQMLSPQKARILLMLALTKTKDWKKIQGYFQNY